MINGRMGLAAVSAWGLAVSASAQDQRPITLEEMLPAGGGLTVADLIAGAGPMNKLLLMNLWFLMIVGVGLGLAAVVMGLRRRRGGAADAMVIGALGIVAKLGFLLGAIGAAGEALRILVTVANTNTSNLAVIAPSLAEAFVVLVQGLWVGLIAILARDLARTMQDAKRAAAETET